MIVTKKSLPRRTVLRGLGSALALPYLDAMTPACARAAASPLRLGVVFVPMGMHMAEWTPVKEGALELTPILRSLAPFQDLFSSRKSSWEGKNQTSAASARTTSRVVMVMTL